VAVRAAPDGHTLLMVGPPNVINASLYENLSYDFLRDIALVASIIRVPNVLVVNSSFPAKNISEFMAYAKANRGRLSMGSACIGTAAHMAGELFKMLAGIDMLHVPYRGAPQAESDLLGGQIQVFFDPLPLPLELIRAGKLRALAVTTSGRLQVLPDVPPLADFVPGYEASFWYGVGVPRNTPSTIIETLNKQINAALADPTIKARLSNLGGEVFPVSPADFEKLIADETEKWAKVIKFANIKPE
jgi:tripartite-type tricarboxylate transporter receptor subunit TctC